ncbi:hypothetical protein [Filomicrobium sp.]|uniref:hypothetical protein n=1 Tax=Filomicrobium sp. TaxID=2024831 RepID=UPI002588B5FE|nr:hypothetical protein [Filomicrobium sp.]MCV0371726.1 hypothetical protein [Filomicrobium sp.]
MPEGIRVVQGKDGRPRFQGPDGKFVKMVPHGALHKTRERLKEEKRARAEIQEKWARGEERLNILNEAFNGGGQTQQTGATQQKPDDPFSEEPIDPGQDIFGAYEQLQRQNKALFDRFSSTQTQQQTREYATHLMQAYHADTEAFKAREPQYDDAVRHVVNVRIAQLKAMGITDPAQINQTIQQEESDLAVRALTSKKSAAAMFFEMAKALGFQPTAQNGNVNQNNGKNPAVEKIEQINRGKQAADTLSNAGGSANEGLTIERLANMTDDEFAAARASMPKAQFERLMGKV